MIPCASGLQAYLLQLVGVILHEHMQLLEGQPTGVPVTAIIWYDFLADICSAMQDPCNMTTADERCRCTYCACGCSVECLAHVQSVLAPEPAGRGSRHLQLPAADVQCRHRSTLQVSLLLLLPHVGFRAMMLLSLLPVTLHHQLRLVAACLHACSASANGPVQRGSGCGDAAAVVCPTWPVLQQCCAAWTSLRWPPVGVVLRHSAPLQAHRG